MFEDRPNAMYNRLHLDVHADHIHHDSMSLAARLKPGNPTALPMVVMVGRVKSYDHRPLQLASFPSCNKIYNLPSPRYTHEST